MSQAYARSASIRANTIYICTECGAYEYFPEAECGVEGCVKSLYSFHPECHCPFQPRCREHAYWECARCSPKRTQLKSAVVQGEIVSSDFDEESAKSKSVNVSDVLECEHHQTHLPQLGWQVVDPVSGVLSPAEKHDWAKHVLLSDPKASRIHASKILGLGVIEPAEDAWWRGARVSRQDAAIVLVDLGIACDSPAAAIAEWDGIGQHYESCPSDQLWRQWVSRGRKCMRDCGLDDLE